MAVHALTQVGYQVGYHCEVAVLATCNRESSGTRSWRGEQGARQKLTSFLQSAMKAFFSKGKEKRESKVPHCPS